MAYAVKTMNKIDPQGLSLLGTAYSVGEDANKPHAILVRSAKVNTSEYSGLLAVARAGAGYNNITVDQATEAGVCVFNTPGANANAVAELAMTLMGYAVRRVGDGIVYAQTLTGESSNEAVTEKVEANKSKFKGVELRSRTLGVLGLGKIGVLTANYGVGHGMNVHAYDPFPTPWNMHSLNSGVKLFSTAGEMVTGVDVLSVHVPLSDKTKNLVGDEMLSSLNDGAIVLNLSRDGVVDDAAVLKALDSGKLFRYITDFPSLETLRNDKVICVPHLGASTEESEVNCAVMAVQQIKDYLEFGNITNSVNFPAIQVPFQSSTKNRLVVINRDVPNMIADITGVIGKAGLNIQGLVNESNGKIGYNIIDLEVDCPADVLEGIQKLQNILRVRLIST